MSMAVLTLIAVYSTLAYASDDHSCHDGTCKTPDTTQGMSLLMTHTRLEKTQPAISTGDKSCPCLTPSKLDSQGGYFPEKVYEKQVNGKWYKNLPECNDPLTEWLLPADLGIGQCDNMETHPPFCGTGDQPRRWKHPDWMCKQKFCHVDPATCPPDWVITGNLFPGLPFSYKTCLAKDASDEEKTRVDQMTHILQQDHRAYHCAADALDDKLQKDADKVTD